jgi:hypothetical protein
VRQYSNRALHLVVVGHGGPLLVGVTWRSPDIYHQAGIERGTATSTSTTRGRTSAAFFIVYWDRQSQWNAIAKGQLIVWGRKPWLGFKFRSLIRNP